MPLLDVKDLRLHFHTRKGLVRAVNGVSFALEAGEMLGIVGESGSGKSVTCNALMGLNPSPPARIEGGSVRFCGKDILNTSNSELRDIRGREIAMIFQDPMTALNPYMRIGDQLIEPLLLHGMATKTEARNRAVETLRSIGMPQPEDCMKRWPHEFSGGMRQRVMIAMALISRPRLLIADEPTTALDVTVQAQILELLASLRQSGREALALMAIILISHDLSVVAESCDRVMVMYAGQVMESAPAREIWQSPMHPYTHALLRAIPAPTASGTKLTVIPGEPPDMTQDWQGCPFAPRCAYAQDACRENEINLQDISPNHQTACLRVQKNEIDLTEDARHK